MNGAFGPTLLDIRLLPERLDLAVARRSLPNFGNFHEADGSGAGLHGP